MKKETCKTICWLATLSFITFMPPYINLWQGIVLTCLAGGSVVFTVPEAVKEAKALILFKPDATNPQSHQEIWTAFYDAMIAMLAAGWTLVVLTKGIATIIRYF